MFPEVSLGSMKITDLTAAEKLKLDRRRRGESQEKAAKHWGVSFYKYREAEDGKRNLRGVRPALGKLRPYEICFIRRIRSDISVKKMAKKLKRHPWWISQMERGKQPADELVEHWAA